MKKFIFLFIIIFSVLFCQAQTSTPPNASMSEIGLNVTQMFSTLLGGDGNSDLTGPYFLTYKNIKSDGRTLRLGVGAKMEQRREPNTEAKINDSGFDLRIGYEKQIKLAPKWITYLGIDFLGGFHNVRAKNVDFTASSRTWDLGTGPVFGVQWMFSSQVGLSTETALYYRHTEFIDLIKSENNNTPFDSKDRSFVDDINFILPTTLFLSVRF